MTRRIVLHRRRRRPVPARGVVDDDWDALEPTPDPADLARAELSALTSLAQLCDAVRGQIVPANSSPPAQSTPPVAAAQSLIRLRNVGLPPNVLRKAIRRGELTGTKIGRDYYLNRTELRQWIEQHRVKLEPANENDDGDQHEPDPFLDALHSGRLRRIK